MANKEMKEILQSSFDQFNSEKKIGWKWGDNFTRGDDNFKQFTTNYLFPKITSTTSVQRKLGNRFLPLAKHKERVGEFTEEYAILDSIPIDLDLNKDAELIFARNYAQMASKLYGPGEYRKLKFTLNETETRNGFSNIAQASQYAYNVFTKKLSDVNVDEEKELKGMLIDYSLTKTKEKREVSSQQDLVSKIYEAVLNLQNNSYKYNETRDASNGELGFYTTQTPLEDLMILCNDRTKARLLDTEIANAFNISGLDLTDHIISFDFLGENYKLTQDVKIANDNTVNFLKALGDYRVKKGDYIRKGSIITFDPKELTEFNDKYEEIKPKNEDLFAYIVDVNKIRYFTNFNIPVKTMENGETLEYQYWLHYYTLKAMSPFYNNITLCSKEDL